MEEPEGAREKGGDDKNLDKDVTRAKDLCKVADKVFDKYKAKRDEANEADMEAAMIRQEAAQIGYSDAFSEALNKKKSVGELSQELYKDMNKMVREESYANAGFSTSNARRDVAVASANTNSSQRNANNMAGGG